MTATRTAAAPTWAAAPAPALTLDERLALTRLDMDIRLGDQPLNLADVIQSPPILPTPADQLSPYRTPIALLLHRAQTRLATAGWTPHAAVDGTGAMCPLHAIHLEASSQREEGQARSLFLDAIRSEWPRVENVPHWNASQPGPANPIRMLGAAARLADSRSL